MPEVFKCDFCRCAFYYVRVKPRNRRILLDIAILRQEFGLFACGHFRNCYFLAEEVREHRNAHVRVCLLQLFNIVPFFHIVNHVEERQKAAFLAIAFQESRASLHQFIVNSVVLISRRGNGQDQRLPPCAKRGFHNLVLLQTAVAAPACNLIIDDQMRVEAVAFLRIERQRLNNRVRVLYVNIGTPLFRQLRKLRFFLQHLVKVIVNNGRLIQFRRKAIYFRAVFSIKIRHICDNGRRKKRLAVLPAYDNKHFTEDAQAVRVHDPEDNGNTSLLPYFQLQKVFAAFAMVTEVFYKLDRFVGLLRIEEIFAPFKPRYDDFINQPNPFANRIFPALNT